MKPKSKSQVKYLLSQGSPLSGPQKAILTSGLHSGAVKVRSKPVKKPTTFSQAEWNKAHAQVYK